ncbi:hypothetical protein GOP47_0014253 [Adiantum capillus-veneris]|uniref:Uncharacterized protein n=1 Tax=Adiantum capillus-veneris TaxID=13818 RepID=A0A9D4ZDZ2_ADICA|nr:hypothetical protein GOP47_0014253 [Adiantum capillus-veneris]
MSLQIPREAAVPRRVDAHRHIAYQNAASQRLKVQNLHSISKRWNSLAVEEGASIEGHSISKRCFLGTVEEVTPHSKRAVSQASQNAVLLAAVLQGGEILASQKASSKGTFFGQFSQHLKMHMCTTSQGVPVPYGISKLCYSMDAKEDWGILNVRQEFKNWHKQHTIYVLKVLLAI